MVLFGQFDTVPFPVVELIIPFPWSPEKFLPWAVPTVTHLSYKFPDIFPDYDKAYGLRNTFNSFIEKSLKGKLINIDNPKRDFKNKTNNSQRHFKRVNNEKDNKNEDKKNIKKRNHKTYNKRQSNK